MFWLHTARARAGRRRAQTAGPAALALAGFALVSALAGCQHGDSSAGAAHGRPGVSGKRPAPEVYAESAPEARYAGPNRAPGAAPMPAMATAQALTVETGDLKKAEAGALRINAEAGGTVQQQNEGDDVRETDPTKTPEKSKDYTGYVTLGLQIPVDTFDRAVSQLRTLGEVTYANSQATNVSQQAVDLDAELADVRSTVARLEQLRAQTNDPDVLVKVQNQLTAQHSRLLELQRQQQGLDKRVQTVSMTVTLLGKKPAGSGGNWIAAGLRSGWSDLIGAAQWLVTAIAWLAVWLVPAVVVLVALRLGWRLLRGRRA